MDYKNPPQDSQGDRQRNDEEDSQIIVEASPNDDDDDGSSSQFPRPPNKPSILAMAPPQHQQTDDVRVKINKRRHTYTLSGMAGRLVPPLPETIEFQTAKPSKKQRSSASDTVDEPRAYAPGTVEHEQLETYRREVSQEQQHLPGNEFLMESLFMLLYLRRSKTMIPISIPLLHSTEHPILLTLASYPFRVLFSNDAHQNLRGCTDTVGRTLFECFESDEDTMNPSLSSYPNFLKLILDGRPCYINSRDRDGHITAKVCTIKAEEVFSKKGEEESLQYYAIHFIVAT